MSGLLEIATSGLLANQRSLDTIAHNIANSSNPDYNRQTTETKTRSPINLGYGFVGSGVDVSNIRRVVDEFVVDSIRVQQSNFNELDTFSRISEQVARVLSDSSVGISKGLDDFFASMQELNNDPGSIPARQLLTSNGNVLENRFRQISSQVNSQFQNVRTEMEQDIAEVNRLASNIADSNLQIIRLSRGGSSSTPNDLLDQRDALIQHLSKKISVSTSKQEDGSLNVFIGSGQPLIIRGSATTLALTTNVSDPTKQDVSLISSGSNQPITSSITGGSISGLLSIQNELLPKIQNSIGRVAISLSQSMNSEHHLGMDLNGDLGGDIFNNINDVSNIYERVLARSSNTGDAVFSLIIDPINKPLDDEVVVSSSASGIVDTGTLSSIISGSLVINGVTIPATAPGNDLLSTTDNSASAIAIAAAINNSTGQHGVVASSEPNILNLGQFTTGAFALGEFQINGQNIVSLGTSNEIIIQDINALESVTGVSASLDNLDNIILQAADGRNIQLTSNTNTPAATFSYFDTNSGTALDKVVRAGVKLTEDSSHITISGINPASVGFAAATTPVQYQSLTASDYSLKYDGTFYNLTRLSDNVRVAQSNTPTISADGFTVNLEYGTIANGDEYILQPTKNGATLFKFRISDPLKLAMASPIAVGSSLNNDGNGKIHLDKVTNTSGLPQATSGVYGNAFSTENKLSPPIRIEFISNTKYKVLDMANGGAGVQIGPVQSFDSQKLNNSIFPLSGVVDYSTPGPNTPYTYDPGYRVSISGSPAAGDTFEIGYNSNAAGDNRNGLNLVNLQFEKLLSNNSATYQDTYIQIISEIGTQSAQAKVNAEASESLLNSILDRKNEISGVNIDEEATNLLKFQQAFQAAAQVIVIARTTFDTLIHAFGG